MELDSLMYFAENYNKLTTTERSIFREFVYNCCPEDISLPDMVHFESEFGCLNADLDARFKKWFDWFDKFETEDEEDLNLDE